MNSFTTHSLSPLNFLTGPELGIEPKSEVPQTPALTVVLFRPSIGKIEIELSLAISLTLEPSNNFNLALTEIGIEILPFESILEIKLDFSLVN